MYYAATQQMNDARQIARTAQQQIKDKTGMQVTVVLYPTEHTTKTPERMLYVIALALDMNPKCFKMKSRRREIVEMRFIAAMLLRTNFPAITLQQIATLFGGQDHSSIISGLARANDLIHTGDERFVKKYNTVVKAVGLWLKNDLS
jgi:chromosomal replication initiation ATPase DnaA